MSQTPCIAEYFSNLKQSGIGSTLLEVTDEGGGVFQLKAQRPFFPVQGIWDSGLPGTVTNQKIYNTSFATFFTLYTDCYNASVNYTDGISSYPRILPGTFDQYFYKKIFGKTEPNNRFAFMQNLIVNYWTACDAGLTANEQFESIEKYKKHIIDTTDKEYFIPAGTYQFDATCAFLLNWQAWQSVESEIFYIDALEIISI